MSDAARPVVIDPAATPPRVLSDRVSAIVYPLVSFGLLLLLWQYGVRAFGVPEYILPLPTEFLAKLWAERPLIATHTLVTAQEIVLGFLMAAGVSIPLGFLIVSVKPIERALYPLIVFFQLVPKIAIAPLFVVWFGFGLIPKVISAFMLGFFPVVVSTVMGFKSVDLDMIDLARSMKASRLATFVRISLPQALPSIFAGLKVSVTLAVVGAVVGEFVGSISGIGYVMQRSIGTFDLPTMFAALVILALLGVILFWVVDRIERLVIPWHVSQREIVFAS